MGSDDIWDEGKVTDNTSFRSDASVTRGNHRSSAIETIEITDRYIAEEENRKREELEDEMVATSKKCDDNKVGIILCIISGAILGGIIGGVGFSFLPDVLVDSNPWYSMGIPAMVLGILGYKIDGCSSGCGGLILGALGMAFFCWLLSAISIIATFSIGAVLGVLIGCGVGWLICKKVYDI